MDCFIKKIWDGKGEDSHYQFARFGKGIFENRALLSLQKTSKIKLKGSFEWVNDFVEIVSELGGIKFSGIVLSKEQLNLENEKKKSEVFQYDISDINSEKIKEIKDKAYVMLLSGEGEGIVLKIKKKLPKPGKSKNQIDDKFCQLESDLKYWGIIKQAFMLPECRKCKISHVFEINKIIIPEREEDFVKIREIAKRKGKIIRKIEINGGKSEKEMEFEA